MEGKVRTIPYVVGQLERIFPALEKAKLNV